MQTDSRQRPDGRRTAESTAGRRPAAPTSPNERRCPRRVRRSAGGPRPPDHIRIVKLAVVVQRYGADINGGAELHARYVAERLSRHASVEVLTTCARDYVTWRTSCRPGEPTRSAASPSDVSPSATSARRTTSAVGPCASSTQPHSHRRRARLARQRGPGQPGCSSHTSSATRPSSISCCFFSYRYYHAWHGRARLPHKAVLVPTAERDPAIGLSIFGPIFRGVRALMYNSPEERAMIQAASGNEGVPGVVVGVGSDVPDPHATRPASGKAFGITGRSRSTSAGSTQNKGCAELFSHFQRYAAAFPRGLDLVLDRQARSCRCPKHPRIRHLGFLPDRDKFDALAAADLLIMPSYFESLSMVALEAWALGQPVLANGACDVLQGQCVRSNAGLYYENLRRVRRGARASLEANGPLNAAARPQRPRFLQAALRVAGHRAEVSRHVRAADSAERPGTIEPEPGGFARRRARQARRGFARHAATCRPRDAVLGGIPTGTALPTCRGSERPPGARDARLWRRHRPRSARHPARAAAAGYASEIFVETADQRLEHLTTRLPRPDGGGDPADDVLIHHFSIGSRASRTAYALPGRMALVYHNITPPEYFVGVHEQLVELCFQGRRELTALSSRACDLALGDSEFNRAELERSASRPRASCRSCRTSPISMFRPTP